MPSCLLLFFDQLNQTYKTITRHGYFFNCAVFFISSTDAVEDTCNPIPTPKNVTLPAGCVVKGTTNNTVDVGECKPVPCLRNDTNITASCKDQSFCCGPKAYAQVEIQCGSKTRFNVSQVLQCGCGEHCTELDTYLMGKVVGPGEVPMQYGDIIIGGKPVTYTEHDGTFSVKVSKGKQRMTLTFIDSNDELLEDVTKSFEIEKGELNFYKIVLPNRNPPVSFNASEPIEIPLGELSENQSSFAELEIPANSLLSEDGTLFTGQANVRMSVTDPRNETDVLSAPGDFTAVAEDGEQQMLQTFGMMKMTFKDDVGKPLAVAKPMKVFIDPEQVNITVDKDGKVAAKLYWLDEETGRWRQAGEMSLADGGSRRRKRDTRKFFVAEILPAMTKSTLNFDKTSTGCRVRVKAERQSIVRIFRKDGGGYVERVTDNDGMACIPTWKDTESYMQVEKNGVLLEPIAVRDLPSGIKASIVSYKGSKSSEIKTLSFTTAVIGQTGPIYSVGNRRYCDDSENSQPTQQHITFSGPNTTPETPDDFVTKIVGKEWNAVYGGNKLCYIKIKVLAQKDEKLSFIVQSFREGNWDESFGLTVGTSILAKDGGHVLCLEYRCRWPPGRDKQEATYVLVSPLTGTCRSFDRSKDMDLSLYKQQTDKPRCAKADEKSKEQVVSFCVPTDSSGRSTYGTYIGDAEKDLGWKGCLMSINDPKQKQTEGNLAPGKEWKAAEQAKSDSYTLKYDCR